MDIFKEVIVRNEQITTCPICGSRTDIILDLSHTLEETQIHECLSKNCKYLFVEITDNDT